MDNKAWFLKTQDAYTAQRLIEDGLELVDEANGVWTFVNNPNRTLNFDNKKVVYSNKLVF